MRDVCDACHSGLYKSLSGPDIPPGCAHKERHLRAEGSGEQVAAHRGEVFASVLEGFQVLFIDAKGSGASIQGQRCSGSAYFLFLLAAVKQGRSSVTLGSNIVELSVSFTIIHSEVVPSIAGWIHAVVTVCEVAAKLSSCA